MMKPAFAEVLRASALLACTAVLAACGSHGNEPALSGAGMPLGAGRAAGHEHLDATSQTIVMAGVDSPRGVAVDAAGNVYIADTGNGRVVKLGADGSYAVHGSGLSDVRSVATNGADIYVAEHHAVERILHNIVTPVGSEWHSPTSVALDRFGSLYVADLSGVVRKIATDGTMTTIGLGWKQPSGVAVDRANGDVYVVDRYAGTLSKVAKDGTVSVVASGFREPENIAIDWQNSDVYIADALANRIEKVAPNGRVTTVGSGFKTPYGVAIDPNGKLYVADTGNSEVKRIATDGRVSTIAGLLKFLRGIALDPSGSLYVADQFEGRVIKIDPANQTLTKVGSGFKKPVGVAVDAGYTVYVTDTADPAVKRIALNGTVSASGSGWRIPTGVTVDRSTGDVYVADNALGLWQVKPHGAMSAVGSGWVHPSGVTFDPRNQDLYVVDPGLAELAKVTLSGKVTTVADRLPRALAVAIDEKNGYAWVADPADDEIERIAPDGSVWTYGHGSGIKAPYGIAVDKSANVYVTDAGNYLVWKLTF